MPKRIAVIATKAKFKEIRKFIRKSFAPNTLDSSTDDYLAVMDLYLYRIDYPNNNFIDAYEWSGYLDAVGWEVEHSNEHWATMQRNLLNAIEAMERKEVPQWNAAKICREIEELAIPF